MKPRIQVVSLIALSVIVAVYVWGFAKRDVVETTDIEMTDVRSYAPAVLGLAFATDGKSLMTIGRANDLAWEVNQWTFDRGHLDSRHALSGFTGQKLPGGSRRSKQLAAVSSDANLVAIASGLEDTATLVSLYRSNGELLCQVDSEAALNAMAFSPDGRTLATGDSARMLKLWDVTTGRVMHSVEHEFEVTAVAFSPDSETVLSGSNCNVIRCGPGCDKLPWGDVRLTSTNKPFQSRNIIDPVTPAFFLGVGAVAFSPDGVFAVIANGGELRFWHLRDEKFTTTITSQESRADPDNMRDTGISGVAFSPDGSLVAAGCACRVHAGSPYQIYLWQVTTGKLLSKLKGHRQPIRHLAFSSDSRYLASTDGKVKVWDTNSTQSPLQLRLRHAIKGHKFFLKSLAFSPDGKTLASGAKEGNVKFWDVATGQQRHVIDCRRTIDSHFEVNSVAYLSNGKRIVLAGGSQRNYGEAHVLDWQTFEPVFRLRGHKEPVESMAVTRDGQRLVTSSYDGKAVIWDLTSGEQVRTISTLKTAGTDITIALSPDDRTLATRFHPPQLWDLQTGELRGAIGDPANESAPFAIAFSPDGDFLVTGNYDGTLNLWDAETRRLLATTHWHLWQVFALAYSPDGRWVAAGSGRNVAVFDASFPWVQGIRSEVGVATAAGHTDRVLAMTFNPTGDLLATASQDGQICIWEVTSR